MTEHACMRRHMAIGQADLYEQTGLQTRLRIQVTIAEQSPDIYRRYLHQQTSSYFFKDTRISSSQSVG